MDVSVLDLGNYGYSAPEGLIDLRSSIVFDILKNASSFFDTEPAHTASRADGKFAAVRFDCTERTEF